MRYFIDSETLEGIAGLTRELTGMNDTMSTGTMQELLGMSNTAVMEALAVLAEKGADVSSYSGIADLPRIIAAMSGGGGGAAVSAKDVNFYDYDGTLLYSYTIAEAQALASLPDGPTHDGLFFQRWNWSLDKVKALTRKMNIGALYTTDDGTTRIYIHLEEGRTSPMLGICPNGTVTVDWGDGTTPDTLTGTSVTTVKWTPTHNYAEPGDYVIKLTVSGTAGFYGSSSSNQYAGILRYSAGTDSRNHVYRNSVQRVETGDGVTSIGAYAFGYCYSLSSVTIPDGVTSIGAYAFQNCNSLSSITIPDGVTSIDAYAFGYCYSLSSITIPDGVTSIGIRMFDSCRSLSSITIPDSVTSIGNYVFIYCHSLSSVTIPDGVTSIGAYAFQHCYSAKFYDFSTHTSVPTLSSTNAFSSIPADCEIRVPAALCDEWIAATNWSTYASYIVAV